jgi:putative FmdB family regulatory protein
VPTYEYACKSCKQHLEVVQSFKDDALTVCPNCGGQLRKVFGNIGIAFKGSGFYKTDSRSKVSSGSGAKTNGSNGDSAKSDTAAGDKHERKSESSGDSKSESKSEAKSDSSTAAKREAKTATKPEKSSAAS